jgi:hypothetical protein
MLFFLLVSLVGIDAVRQGWRHVWITPFALSAALLVKGVFVAVPLLAVGLWILINPRRLRGGLWRPIVTCAISLAVMAAVALVYDALYLRATGETFWGPYWNRQLAPLTLSSPGANDEASFGPHLRFYLVRMLWHPAPWSFALLVGIWNRVRHPHAARAPLSPEARRGLLFAGSFAVVSILMLSPISRFAERYAFSANYAVAAIGIVTALGVWPSLRAALERLDRAVPALPALVWLTLMLLRLAIGPFLPRISA